MIAIALHSSRLKLQKAFTLIELMVSLAVIAIIITLGIPNLLDTLVTNRVNSAIISLNKDIISARNFAVSYENNITMCHLNTSNECDKHWTKGYSVFIDANANNIFDATDDKVLLKRNQINSKDSLVFTDGNSIQFAFDGTVLTQFADENVAAFKYCPNVADSEEYARAIMLNLSGRPRTSEDIDNDNKDELSGNNDHITCS